jgi:Cytochrome P450
VLNNIRGKSYGYIGRERHSPGATRPSGIPGGSLLVLCQYITQRHPDFWEDPERFDPERFSAERSAGRPKFAYFPFGGGARQCIGNHFAILEGQLILATIAQHYSMRLVPGHVVEPDTTFTLPPRHGVLVTLNKRQCSAFPSPPLAGERGRDPCSLPLHPGREDETIMEIKT